MLIIVNYVDTLSIQSPGTGFLVELHVNLGTNYYNLGFVCIKPKLVPVSIVTDDVHGSLQTTWCVGEQVSVICDTDSSGADGANGEPELGAVQDEKARIYVNF